MNAHVSSDRDRALAYAVFRFTLGVNILLHGLQRILGGIDSFVQKTMPEFANAPLPGVLVHAFLVVLPVLELGLGLLITVGWLTRWALFFGGLMICALAMGTALRGDWNTLTQQMIYAIVYYLLLAHVGEDRFSVDRWLRLWGGPGSPH
ncbi:MAG TPA: DoxX family protein [Bryobacteraceae bacterium]|nr:DoxX family protein [Bryobacteraceae bacterium]